jgi:hypothetical protein
LRVFDIATGKLLWERKLAEHETVLQGHGTPHGILITSEQGLSSYEPHTGNKQWEIDGQVIPEGQPLYTLISQDRRNFANKANYLWGPFTDSIRKINAVYGEVLAGIPYNKRRHFSVINDQYVFIQEAKDAEEYWRGSEFHTILFDLHLEEAIWKMEGKGTFGVVEGEMLYFLHDSVPTTVHIKTGAVKWRTEDLSDPQRSIGIGGKQILLNDKYVLVPGSQDVFIIDKETGRLLHRVNNVHLGYAELRDQETHYGLVTQQNGYLYVGSANGYFTKMKID